MKTYVLPEFEQDAFNKAVPVPRSAGHRGPSSFASTRLSAFNMPDEIALGVEEPGVVRFLMGYPNDEPPSEIMHKAGDGIRLRVGKFSGKILEVQVIDAIHPFRSGVVKFDPSVADSWASTLPADRQFACRRNAEVVSLIVRAMPEDARNWVLEQLKRFVMPGQTAPEG